MNGTAEATELKLNVSGMDCASCVAHVQKAAKSVAGVKDVNVSLAMGQATVQFDPSAASADAIASAITSAGYPSSARAEVDAGHAERERVDHQAAHARSWARRAVIGTALWFPVEL